MQQLKTFLFLGLISLFLTACGDKNSENVTNNSAENTSSETAAQTATPAANREQPKEQQAQSTQTDKENAAAEKPTTVQVQATAELAADLALIRQTLDGVLQAENNEIWVQQLQQAQTREEKNAAYQNIIDTYQQLINTLDALNLQTENAKALRAKYHQGLVLFIELMHKSAEFSDRQPSEEEIQAYSDLQNNTTSLIAEAEQLSADLSQAVAEAPSAEPTTTK